MRQEFQSGNRNLSSRDCGSIPADSRSALADADVGSVKGLRLMRVLWSTLADASSCTNFKWQVYNLVQKSTHHVAPIRVSTEENERSIPHGEIPDGRANADWFGMGIWGSQSDVGSSVEPFAEGLVRTSVISNTHILLGSIPSHHGLDLGFATSESRRTAAETPISQSGDMRYRHGDRSGDTWNRDERGVRNVGGDWDGDIQRTAEPGRILGWETGWAETPGGLR
jgi:hypothetical protein